MTTGFEGRVAVVTGAAHGIGSAYAQRLAERGVSVVVADIDGDGAMLEAKRLQALGLRASATTVNIADPDDAKAAIDRAVEREGRLDILVNNAGLYRGFQRARAEDIPIEDWNRMLAVNVSGTLNMCRAAIPHMRANGFGRIVNQSSASALVCRPMSLHYSVSKAALLPMTKVLAREVADAGITVNAVAPGFIETEATAATFSDGERELIVPMIPMRRAGTTDDVAGLVEFLCSDSASYLTGQTIAVDGGLS